MSHHVQKVKLVMCQAKNGVGVGADIFETVAAAGANLVSVCAWEEKSNAGFLIEADDNNLVKKGLRKAKMKFRNVTGLRVAVKNKPGALAEICRALADKKINIGLVVATPGKANETTVYLTTSADARAFKILEAM